MLEYSKRIDELKIKEQEAYRKFLEAKEKFSQVNAKLKEKLPGISAIKNKLETFNIQVKEEKQKKERLTLKEKGEIANQKLKSGQKLTTEDLLALQSLDND